MSAYAYERRRHDVITIPTIRVAFVLSLLVHAALLWLLWPHLQSLTQTRASDATSPLAVQLAPRRETIASATTPTPPTTPRASAPPSPPPATTVPVPRRRPPQPPKPAQRHAPPPVIAQHAPSPAPLQQPAAPLRTPSPAPAPSVAPPVAQPSPMPSPPAQDLASYVEAQRRARGEASDATPSAASNASAESEIARRDRIVAANLGLGRTPTFGTDVRNAGGLFQITDLGYDDARFYFMGFDKAIGRNARQLIEVRKGADADIRIAVVRRMVAIIRENVSGDFVWVSQRLGRNVTLSARPADNAGLEDFILHDIFPDARP